MEFHYVITAQRPHPRGGVEVATKSGTVTFEPGVTRAVAFSRLWNGARAGWRWPLDEGSVLFFDLAPNFLV